MYKSPQERFDSFISPEPTSGCWLWTGHTNQGGYGIFSAHRVKSVAHRFNFERYRGRIPKGLDLDHLCRVRCCVNPWHLEPVTLSENVKRGEAGKYQTKRTHCPQGHEYTPDNTYCPPGARTPRRCCRQCAKLRVV